MYAVPGRVFIYIYVLKLLLGRNIRDRHLDFVQVINGGIGDCVDGIHRALATEHRMARFLLFV